MKGLLICIGFLFAVTVAGSPSPATGRAASSSHRQSAIAVFTKPVRLLGVILQGEYMFVHDDELMMSGNACTYVYKLEAGQPDKLVVSFHCIPTPREQVATFTVRTSPVSSESMLYEVQEYQFAGSSEAHQVPSADTQAKSANVDLVGCCL